MYIGALILLVWILEL